jgi:hypothetical protein
MPRSFDCSLTFRLFNQNFVCTAYLLVCATCPAHHILLGLMILIISDEQYKLQRSSYIFFSLPSHHPSSVQIILSTLFSNTLNLCPSLKVGDQFSNPYKKNRRLN